MDAWSVAKIGVFVGVVAAILFGCTFQIRTNPTRDVCEWMGFIDQTQQKLNSGVIEEMDAMFMLAPAAIGLNRALKEHHTCQ